MEKYGVEPKKGRGWVIAEVNSGREIMIFNNREAAEEACRFLNVREDLHDPPGKAGNMQDEIILYVDNATHKTTDNDLDEVDAYLLVARDLLQGIEVLSKTENLNPRSCAILAGHALECILKAFLYFSGTPIDQLRKRDICHNLIALWKMSSEKNILDISKAPPTWCEVLSLGHGSTFPYRYQKGPKGAIYNLLHTPELNNLNAEIKNIFEKVEETIKK